MFSTLYRILFAVLFIYLFSCKTDSPQIQEYRTWSVYNGNPEGIKYSSLDQIDTTNVNSIKVAWQYHSGDADTASFSQMQCSPIVIGDRLYGVNPKMKLFCLNAITGQEIWKYDANAKTRFDQNARAFHAMINSRGVAYWTDGNLDKRIFFNAGSSIFAINADTGVPITSFGNEGSIDLHQGLGKDVSDLLITNSSPVAIYENILITGSRIDENLPAAPGHIRAYDVRTGQMLWIFHTIPYPGEFGYDTWKDTAAYRKLGAANVWSGFTIDPKRGLVFCGTGSAAYDFYGGNRLGDNLFANCILALDARTGKRKWHYQTIHHDVWDKDLPTPPVLVTINRNGKQIDAIAQVTKNAALFLLERETGNPLFEINEVPVPTNTSLDGEVLSFTQPIPSKPAPIARQSLNKDDINPYLEESEIDSIRKKLEYYRFGNMFTPPGSIPSLVFPGYDGGGEWGGSSYDPATNVLYVNSNEMAWVQEVNKVDYSKEKIETYSQAGKRLYALNCAPCHASDRKGTGNNPSLLNIKKKINAAALDSLFTSGRRMMPAFAQLKTIEREALTSYLLGSTKNNLVYKDTTAKKYNMPELMPYRMKGYDKFLASNGLPAISPPWGTLNAIDLSTGDFKWKVPLGEYPQLKAKGIPATGTENYGGPITTKGGLVFIGATLDGKFRAFNKFTGKIVWEYDLPAAAFASPAMYEINGKQYITIACGGGKLGTRSGDVYISFALP